MLIGFQGFGFRVEDLRLQAAILAPCSRCDSCTMALALASEFGV